MHIRWSNPYTFVNMCFTPMFAKFANRDDPGDLGGSLPPTPPPPSPPPPPPPAPDPSGSNRGTNNNNSRSVVTSEFSPLEVDNKFFLQGLQKGENLNVFFRPNFRFQGERESVKFNLPLQNVLMFCSSNFIQLRSSDKKLMQNETSLIYPTTTEISNIYHIETQMKFRSWLLLKDLDVTWFV